MGRKKASQTAEATDLENGKEAAAPEKREKKQRTVTYLVCHTTPEFHPVSILHIARSLKSARKWVDSSSHLLRQLGKPVIVLQARPKQLYANEEVVKNDLVTTLGR